MSLKNYNTFGISVQCKKLVVCNTILQMIENWQEAQTLNEPCFIIGEGSNILFTEDLNGTVLVNKLKGIEVNETLDAYHLHVNGGENWHNLVQYTLDNGMPGLENLALIPGVVGSAPIQNIGAYGLELKDVFEYADLVNLNDGTVHRMNESECKFGYRESIFKHQFKKGYAIVSVGLILKKEWKPKLNYAGLSKLNPETVTPREIFNLVCAIRRTKLPDPEIIGNAGSFFKNPVVSETIANKLKVEYENMPYYKDIKGIKLSAAWLIDRLELKGYRVRDAAVHKNHAMVLVNLGNASGKDVVELAKYIRKKVGEKFDIWLEPEVRFISATGEVDAVQLLSL
ncbi:hypothetical protein JYU34_020200 [Plutella xylostella]|uniref:UDP-N-acetylmuramate dehydrogenase n=1 Tax=Plutella xylostella TaxID=51655 RepID=A0ABQ7PU07_PLUXY|nr:hypothetical protein JYU34_020200 [Plutella xylostella]